MDEKVIEVPDAPLLVKPSMGMGDKAEKKKAHLFPLLSVEEVFKWAPFQLLVKSFKNKSRFQMPLLSVQGVLKWALITAGGVAFTVCFVVAMSFADIPISRSQTSTATTPQTLTIFQPRDLTPAQDVEVESFTEGYLLFTLPQAAAATVGLLLPRHRARSRWCLAFVALVSAVIAHYLHSRGVLILIAANPGDILFRIMGGWAAVVFVAGDLLSFLSLLIGGAE